MFKFPILYALIGITLMAITDAHNGQNAAALDTEAVETPTTAIDRAKRLESDRPACVMLMGWCASDSEKLIGRASRRCLRKEASIYCKNACALCARKNGNTEEYKQYIKKYEGKKSGNEAEESGNEAEESGNESEESGNEAEVECQKLERTLLTGDHEEIAEMNRNESGCKLACQLDKLCFGASIGGRGRKCLQFKEGYGIKTEGRGLRGWTSYTCPRL